MPASVKGFFSLIFPPFFVSRFAQASSIKIASFDPSHPKTPFVLKKFSLLCFTLDASLPITMVKAGVANLAFAKFSPTLVYAGAFISCSIATWAGGLNEP